MYNLVVSNLVEDSGPESLTISRSRFLEYTSVDISDQLASLSREAIASIKSWPCLLMPEGRGDEEAYVVEIQNLHLTRGELTATFSSVLGTSDVLINDTVWKLREQLGIEQFEFSRTHWAVKERDLLKVFANAGVPFDTAGISRFEGRPLPAPARSDLLEARNAMAAWSHTELDDFLLEAGIDGLAAGRDVGSRHDRANAILRFAFENPGATTAENHLLSAFMMHGTQPTTGDALEEAEPQSPSVVDRPSLDERDRSTREVKRADPDRVFVVHGHDEQAREQVVEFLGRSGLEPIVLHEQPNMGRHLLTKFVDEAELVTFAVVLMTDDDLGGTRAEKLAPRARQNVILELGYFLSHLGQRRVCALITPGLDTPSDYDGIAYISMDADDRWKEKLERELRAADLPVNDG